MSPLIQEHIATVALQDIVESVLLEKVGLPPVIKNGFLLLVRTMHVNVP